MKVNPEFPSLDKEGLGVIDICTDPLFSITFSLCSGEKQLSATPCPASRNPQVWGLGCPGGTGRGKRDKLTELRLRRIADVQKQRLRQPDIAILCFHRHSRIVRTFLECSNEAAALDASFVGWQT